MQHEVQLAVRRTLQPIVTVVVQAEKTVLPDLQATRIICCVLEQLFGEQGRHISLGRTVCMCESFFWRLSMTPGTFPSLAGEKKGRTEVPHEYAITLV